MSHGVFTVLTLMKAGCRVTLASPGTHGPPGFTRPGSDSHSDPAGGGRRVPTYPCRVCAVVSTAPARLALPDCRFNELNHPSVNRRVGDGVYFGCRLVKLV